MILYWKINAFIFGSLIGSFLNVVIYRLPKEKSVVAPRSACPHCGFQLKWFHNIPILSYLFLKGRCSSCHNKISIQYPAIELITGIFAFNLFPSEITETNLIYFLIYFSIFCVLLCHLIIDINHHLLLDKLNIFLLAILIPLVLGSGKVIEGLIGAVIGFTFPLLVTWLYLKIRGVVGLGGGDIKLFGVLGFVLGVKGIIYNILFSCFVGAVFSLILIGLKKLDSSKPIAFGPFIIIVSFFQIFFPDSFSQLVQFIFN